MKNIKGWNSFNENSDVKVEKKENLLSTLKNKFNDGIKMYNASSEKAIDYKKKEIDNYFNDNKNIDLKSIANGSKELSTSQSSPYYTGGILVYLDNSAFRSGFYGAMKGQNPKFEDWEKENKKIIELLEEEKEK